MTEKTCTKCGGEKPLGGFYKLRSSKDGHAWACKECVKVETREYKRRTRPQGPRLARERRIALLQDGKKECKQCLQIKVVEDFYYSRKDVLSPHCKSCNSIRCGQWLEKNREKRNSYHRAYMAEPENNERRRQGRFKRVAASPRSVMQITLRHGLARRPTENPANIEDLMEMWRNQKGLCALSGIQMTWNQGKMLPTSISLDRIDSSGGYSKDNLRLLCQCVNAFKSIMTDAETIEIARAIVAKSDERPKLKLVS